MYASEKTRSRFHWKSQPGLLIVKQPSRYFRRVIFPDSLKPEAVVSR